VQIRATRTVLVALVNFIHVPPRRRCTAERKTPEKAEK